MQRTGFETLNLSLLPFFFEHKNFMSDSITAKKQSNPKQSAPKNENIAKNTSGDDSSAEDKAVQSVRNVNFQQKLDAVVSSIFSRCGVPIADFHVSKPLTFCASVSYNLIWNFKCRAIDKPITKISDDTRVLSAVELDDFTKVNSKELEKESKVTAAFIKRLANAKFNELASLSGQIVAFNRIAAIGRSRCKKCRGTRKSRCEVCSGSGSLTCPTCQGRKISCRTCHGSGRIKCYACDGIGMGICSECKGKGEMVVEREIVYDGECHKQVNISLRLPDSDKIVREFTEKDEKVILEAANFEDKSTGSETNHGFKASFAGYAPCFGVHVALKGVDAPFDFILCGKSLKAICRPALLDVVFAPQSVLLSETLNVGSTSVDEKIACVKALASKAILAKTIRTVERYEMECIEKEANRQGFSLETILSEKDNSPRSKHIRNTVKSEIIDKVAKELTENAHGFVSRDFARVFAKNLIDFVPMLMILNPNTKPVWMAVTLTTWLVEAFSMFFMPSLGCAFLGVGISVLVCILTSVLLTKNWTYYSVVSALRLTHKQKKVPSLTQEAIQSGKLLLGSLFINTFLFIIANVT